MAQEHMQYGLVTMSISTQGRPYYEMQPTEDTLKDALDLALCHFEANHDDSLHSVIAIDVWGNTTTIKNKAQLEDYCKFHSQDDSDNSGFRNWQSDREWAGHMQLPR